MKKIFATLFAFVFAASAYAQNVTVNNHAFAVGKGRGVTGYTSLLCGSGALPMGTAGDPVCVTVSGDGTLSAAGVLALASVNANVGTFGSATQCITTTQNAKGLTTAISAANCTPPIGSVTGLGAGVGTALAASLNASGAIVSPAPVRAGDVIYWNGTTWTTLAGNNSGSNCIQENASGVPSFAACGGSGVTSVTPGGGLVSSVTANCSQAAVTATGTLSSAHCVNPQSGTSYAIADSDRGKIITASNAAAQAYTIAQASTAGAFFSGWTAFIENNSTNVAGVVTITATTSQLCAQGVCAATFKIQPGQFARLTSDGTNYQVTENPVGSQVPGTIAADNACTGCVGEYIESNIASGSAVALTTGTPANLTSISLTAGDWAVGGGVVFNPAGTTTMTQFVASANTTSATFPTSPAHGATFNFTLPFTTGQAQVFPIGISRFSLSTPTTVFFVVQSAFAVSTMTAYGSFWARRIR